VLIVTWTSRVANNAQVWRVLDLSGITSSVRESRNFIRAGYVYVNGNQILDFRRTVPLGAVLLFELRFPNGVVKSHQVKVIPREYAPGTNQRSNNPTKKHRKG
jgi:ribosomal protein S4